MTTPWGCSSETVKHVLGWRELTEVGEVEKETKNVHNENFVLCSLYRIYLLLPQQWI